MPLLSLTCTSASHLSPSFPPPSVFLSSFTRQELASKYEGKIACYKVDVDDNADAAGEAGIRAMPTFKVYKNGKQEEEMMGASQDKLKSIFEKYAA